MMNEHEVEETDVSNEQLPREIQDKKDERESVDTEFKVTVRKLEMPVRPRGVLAE